MKSIFAVVGLVGALAFVVTSGEATAQIARPPAAHDRLNAR